MKIKISESGNAKIRIWLPTRLVFNQLSVTLYAYFVKKGICQSQISFDGKSLRKFIRGFYKCRKKFGGKLEIVDIESKNGDSIKIVL